MEEGSEVEGRSNEHGHVDDDSVALGDSFVAQDRSEVGDPLLQLPVADGSLGVLFTS